VVEQIDKTLRAVENPRSGCLTKTLEVVD